MRGLFFGSLPIAVCALAGLTGLASTALATAPGVDVFEAYLQDRPCGNNTFCGSGTLAGFGAVTTRMTLHLDAVPPAAGCVGGVGTRRLTLASDAESTLRLAVKGMLCGSRSWKVQGFRQRSLRGHRKWRYPRHPERDGLRLSSSRFTLA